MAVDRAAALARLHDWNPWWTAGAPDVPAFRRDSLAEIERWLDRQKAVVLTGLRQTGKTTLLLQLIADRARKRDCCYVPLDQAAPDLGRWEASLESLLRLWSEDVAGTPLGRGPLKLVCLDECHFHPLWAREVKGLLDRRWPLRFVVTGSASTTLQREAARLLAGRAVPVHLGPLSLAEMARARLEPERAGPILAVAAEWRKLFGEAVRSGVWDPHAFEQVATRFGPWREEVGALVGRLAAQGGFPEIALGDADAPGAHRLMRSYLALLVQRDFVEFFHVRDTRTLERLIFILAQGTGRILVERKLSSDLGAAINTVRNHVGFLEDAGLVRALRAHVESAARAARLPEKYHFVDAGLRTALVGSSVEDRGHVLDSLVFHHLAAWADRELPAARFTYWRHGDLEVDLVLEHGRRRIAIETHATGTERRGLEAFCERHPGSLAWVVSEGTTGTVAAGRAELPLGLILLLA